MRYYIVSPEVAGGWGVNTVADCSVHPPRVSHLHHQFDGWLGSDLVESFPCFLVTERLANALRNSVLTGFELAPAEWSTSPVFNELHPSLELPRFLWLKIAGAPCSDDFALTPDFHLLVSSNALELLGHYSLAGCGIENWYA
jgi:hypothetical protein